MPKIEIIQKFTYSFAELSEDAKQKALEKLWDTNVDFEWWQYTYEDAETIGLKITGFDMDVECTGHLLKSLPEVCALILENHGKKCETYKTAVQYLKQWKDAEKLVDVHGEGTPEQESALEEVEREFERALLEDYRILLRQEYEYQTSEEAIIETINANDYEFTVDGKLS